MTCLIDENGGQGLRPLLSAHGATYALTRVEAMLPPIRLGSNTVEQIRTFTGDLMLTNAQNHTSQHRDLPCYIPFTGVTALITDCNIHMGGSHSVASLRLLLLLHERDGTIMPSRRPRVSTPHPIQLLRLLSSSCKRISILLDKNNKRILRNTRKSVVVNGTNKERGNSAPPYHTITWGDTEYSNSRTL